jgi:hypothetical protein
LFKTDGVEGFIEDVEGLFVVELFATVLETKVGLVFLELFSVNVILSTLGINPFTLTFPFVDLDDSIIEYSNESFELASEEQKIGAFMAKF